MVKIVDVKKKRRVAEIALLTVALVAMLVTSISTLGSTQPINSADSNGTPCGNMTGGNQTGVHCVEYPLNGTINRTQLAMVDYTLV